MEWREDGTERGESFRHDHVQAGRGLRQGIVGRQGAREEKLQQFRRQKRMHGGKWQNTGSRGAPGMVWYEL